ncbi:DUF1697 domain-containing protein [Phenylobacterium kunshanense]|uniref:DUF1697 domain-containing protein n=1 Tax=Phenylobacterium kunshanense TaxID=1445034 RepID=A0A328B5Y8_9CAUL|nr:DUF1697 domain-containing protein [Phenylobacterium kunshanense]
MTRRLAGLLRAVNVGGRKLLSADLKQAAEAAGLARPQTLLASGNVVFETDLPAAEAAARLEARILEDLGLAADVMARDLAALEAVIAANPFPRQAKDEPSRLMAMFLSAEPQAGVEVLTDACAFGEEVRAGPGCLYVWFPAGAGTSKLSNVLIERRLKVRGTMRNWNTVGKLREMVAG